MSEMRRLSGAEARHAACSAAEVLRSDPRVQLIYLFGSVADAVRSPRDVDLAVLTERALPLDELMRLRADAVTAAGGVPIDLVSLNDASVVLAHEIADTGECLFARSPDIEVDFVTRARARYWDFKPFLEDQWRLAGQRLEERRRRGASS